MADAPSAIQDLRPGWWRRVGIATKVRFHDMRDTAATHLLSGTWGPKWPIKEVSEHLGHSSPKVTEDRYAHLTISATARATESERKHGGEHRAAFSTASSNPLKLAPEEGLEPPADWLIAECNASDCDNLQANALGWPQGSRVATEQARHLLAEIAAGRFDLMLAVQLADGHQRPDESPR